MIFSSPESEFRLDNELTIAKLTFLQSEHPSSLVIFSQDIVEESFDYPHQGPLLSTRRSMDDDLGPLFDKEYKPGPIFEEEAPSVCLIKLEVNLGYKLF